MLLLQLGPHTIKHTAATATATTTSATTTTHSIDGVKFQHFYGPSETFFARNILFLKKSKGQERKQSPSVLLRVAISISCKFVCCTFEERVMMTAAQSSFARL